MIGALALALIPPTAAGYLLMGWLGPRPPAPLRACLAIGWGLGASSCGFFGWLVLAGGPSRGYLAADLGLFAGLAAVGLASRAGDRGAVAAPVARARGLPRPVVAALGAALVASAGSSALLFGALTAREPHGGWDALAIWNLRARFLFLGGDSWAEAFHPALIASHLDYPLLVPSTVARCWAYLGRDSPAASAAVALAFALATVGLLVSSLAGLRGRSQGLLGGLALLATTHLFDMGRMQYADVPLAYFLLASGVALAMGDRAEGGSSRWAALAGMMAGFAAWTKNEGLLFLAALVAARLVAVARTRGWAAHAREARWFALGLAPALGVLLVFKVRYAPANDFLADQGVASVVAKLADPARYAKVGRAMGGELAGLGTGAIAWLAAYRLLLGGAPRRPGVGGGFAWGAAGLLLLGYALVYVTTPLFLPWHLQYSVDRLVVHPWPLAVFAFFLTTATPEEALAGPSNGQSAGDPRRNLSSPGG